MRTVEMASSLSNRSQEADAEGARDGYEAARADTLVELVAASAANHSHHSEDRDHDEDEGGGEDDRGYLVTVITDADALRADREDTDLGECRIQDGPGLAAETARRIACDAPDVGPPHSSGHADTESMKAGVPPVDRTPIYAASWSCKDSSYSLGDM